MQTTPGSTSLASSLMSPQTSLFNCRKSRECAPNGEETQKDEHRPEQREGIVSEKLSLMPIRGLLVFSGFKSNLL